MDQLVNSLPLAYGKSAQEMNASYEKKSHILQESVPSSQNTDVTKSKCNILLTMSIY